MKFRVLVGHVQEIWKMFAEGYLGPVYNFREVAGMAKKKTLAQHYLWKMEIFGGIVLQSSQHLTDLFSFRATFS